MSPFRRKAVENALVAELRELGGSAPSMKAVRDQVAARLGGPLLLPELAGAVQSLRYQGKLEWDRLELRESMKSAGAPPAEGPAGTGGPTSAAGPDRSLLAAPRHANRGAAGPDDDDGPADDYPGEVNDEAVEGPPGNRPLPAEGQAGDEPLSVRPQQRAVPERGMEEPGPDRADDQRTGAEGAGAAAETGPPPRPAPVAGGFVPKRLLHKAGVHAASTRAGSRALPVPKHESEVERLVREECEDLRDRRRRAGSTATVRQPLELRKFGVADMDLAEGVSSLLVLQPNDLMAAISRKHPALWKRVLLLGRATGKRPAETLYDALERGLDQYEAAAADARAAA